MQLSIRISINGILFTKVKHFGLLPIKALSRVPRPPAKIIVSTSLKILIFIFYSS